MKFLKRAVLIAASLFLAWGTAFGYNGAGMIVAMTTGNFALRYFGGTTAGRDSAYVYATPDGLVSIGPGCEGLGLGTIPAGVSVVRQSYLGWEQAGRPLRVLPKGVQQLLVDSTGVTAATVIRVGDSLRVNKVANFDQSIFVNGTSSWMRRVSLGDSLIFPSGSAAIIKMTKGLIYSYTSFGDPYTDLRSDGFLTLRSGVVNTASPMTFISGATTFASGDANGLQVLKTLAVSDSARANKGLYVGGQFIPKILRASATLDFDLSGVTCQDLTITVTGAAVGDDVALGVPNTITTDETLYAWVSSTNTVTVRACDGALSGNPASGTYSVTVIKR